MATEAQLASYTPFLSFFVYGKDVFLRAHMKQTIIVTRGGISETIAAASPDRRRLVERFALLTQLATSTNLLYKIVYTSVTDEDLAAMQLISASSASSYSRVLSLHLVVDCARFNAAACVPIESRDVAFTRLVAAIETFHAHLQSEWHPDHGYDVTPVNSPDLINSDYVEPSDVQLPPTWPTHLPLLPTQIQSLGWMQRFERSVHEEPTLYYNTFVPFLKTSYMYTRSGGSGMLLHEEAYMAVCGDDSIVQHRPIRFNGALLADRTGSGKTATMLALIMAGGRRDARFARGINVVQNSWRIPIAATLLIVPLNLVMQWKQEAAKFGVDRVLNIVTVINKRDYMFLTLDMLRAADIVLTTPDFLLGRIYPTKCRTMNGDAMRTMANTLRAGQPCRDIVFQLFLWRRLVFDEHHENAIAMHSLQHLSNSANSQFTRNLQAEVHWGLSGTPHPLYFSDPIRCSLHNLSLADAAFLESRQRLLLQHTTRRSPYVNHLAAPIHSTTIVALTQREHDMLRAYGGLREPSWQVQLSTTFNAAAFDHVQGGAGAEDVLAAMTFTQLSHVMVARRNQEVTEKQALITRETRTRDEHIQTLCRVRQVDSIDPTSDEFRALTDAEHAAGGSRGTTAEAVIVNAIRNQHRTLQTLQNELTQLQAQRDFFHAQVTMPEESKTCPICMSATSNVITPCGHWFCKECSLQYLRTQPAVGHTVKCPMCNTYSLRKKWAEIQEHQQPAPSRGGTYGSKLHQIAELLRSIKQSGEKAIMFVEWSGLMRAIRAILTCAGLQVGVISGNCNTRASAIQKMQSGELDVLLMSLESSTSGLNLVAANHVIFPHAFVNVPPGAVEQAIARVHRLGQTKQVYVHTFIAEGAEREIHEQQQERARQAQA